VCGIDRHCQAFAVVLNTLNMPMRPWRDQNLSSCYSTPDECVRLMLSVRIVHVIPAPQSGEGRLHPLMSSGKVKSSCSGDYLEGRLQST
jgi:hypothetical protein